jgi:hypothetical protein
VCDHGEREEGAKPCGTTHMFIAFSHNGLSSTKFLINLGIHRKNVPACCTVLNSDPPLPPPLCFLHALCDYK